MTAIDIEALRYVYPDGQVALDHVDLTVAPGERIAVLGPNGAGKTTLMLHLNGVLTATSGAVEICGIPLNRKTVQDIRRRVGLVFQDPDDQLFMPTVAEDVAFGPLNAGLPPDEVERRAASALDRVGMAPVRERPPYRLSAGEKRAVAIATVLAMSPDILLLDEPSSNLDPRGRRRLIELLRSFGHTRIIATHDLELVVDVCSRAILLDGGRVAADGPARDILNDEPLMLAHALERPHSLRHAHPHGGA
mgnify:CR=1 FL=1